MRTPALPPVSLYTPAYRDTPHRFDWSGLLPWGEICLFALICVGFSLV